MLPSPRVFPQLTCAEALDKADCEHSIVGTRRVQGAGAGHSSHGLAIEARGRARTVGALGSVQLMRQGLCRSMKQMPLLPLKTRWTNFCWMRITLSLARILAIYPYLRRRLYCLLEMSRGCGDGFRNSQGTKIIHSLTTSNVHL